MRKYADFFVNNVFMNPLTKQEFKIGDVFLDKVFRGFKIKNNIKRPSFRDIELEKIASKRNKTKFNRRDFSNPNLLISIARKLLERSKVRAKIHGGLNNLSINWILSALKIGVCQGSSPPLRFVFDKPRSPFSPSLDRIDSSNRDYTIKNTRVVCYGINTARSNFNDKDSLQISESLTNFLKKRRNSV